MEREIRRIFRKCLLSPALLLAFALVPAGAFGQGAGTTDSTDDAEPADATAPASAPAATLARIVVCRDVEERAPVDPGESFSSDVGKLTCFTDVRTENAPLQIFHRWYVGDELMAEIPISVKANRWRCWSTKTIRSKWNGPARVDVLTEEGDLLGSVDFALE